jgi:heptosyltransferase I
VATSGPVTGDPGGGGVRLRGQRPRHVCVVLLTGLGDVIHGLPVVTALKRKDPTTRITWVVEPMPAPVLAHHPAVDDVVVFRKREGVRGVAALRRDLALRDFDLALNFNIYFKSIFPTVLSGAPVRLGFDRGRSRDMVWLASNQRLPPGPRRHTQDLFLEFLRVLGVPAGPLEWQLAPTAAERGEQAAFFGRFDRPVAAVVPASANPKKDWPADRTAALIDALEHDLGYSTILVGGPSERELRLAAEILAGAARKPVLAMGDGIRRLLWTLHGSSLVIAPDTGPVHMARAMDVPVVGLYGHTNPWRVGPYRQYQDLWVDAYSDPGEEGDASIAEPRLGRMERITVADVVARVERARASYTRARSAYPHRQTSSDSPGAELRAAGEGPT